MGQTPKDSHTWDAAQLVDGMVQAHGEAVEAVQACAGALEAAIEATVPRLSQGGRLIYIGAGTSGRIAAQDANELPPTYDWPFERAVTLIAGGHAAFTKPVEAAEDDVDTGRADMQALSPTPQDVAIGVAASGTTPYTIAALEVAKAAGALTIALCNRTGSPLAGMADIAIEADTGPEFVHGSTRLAAGTAQKVALNAFSTGTMIRLGKVFQGHMIEMPPTNIKLVARSEAMVCDITGCAPQAAKDALAAADGSAKLAIVMIAKGMGADEARAHLDQAGGSLRDVL